MTSVPQTALPRRPFGPLWGLGRLLSVVVRTKVLPHDPIAELGLKTSVPICYVLMSRSVSDLLVLDRVCREQKLPLPRYRAVGQKSTSFGSYVYLARMGLLQIERDAKKEPPSPLARLVEQATVDPNLEVQIIPVSVFWGRNPGREERSILKLLFFDDEHAGVLQKFFIVLANGRGNLLQFGRPISLRELVDEGATPDETAKKLRRVLRVHFRRQRVATMGPQTQRRDGVINTVLATRAVRVAVEEEARKKNLTNERALARARRYLLEIAADQQHAVVSLLDRGLRLLWNRMFSGVEVKNAQRLRAIDLTHEVVYLPSHRSHLDYLLLSYSIYQEGFVPPHTMAGVNLNFWPIGPLLRRGGAFYSRRSFGGNRLYATVFNEYVHYLLAKGHPVKFYLEGGRSRTGRLLAAKTGMLAMVVHSFLRNSDKPIVLVPVFIAYDKVMEVRTYLSELRGAKKRQESVRQLIGARRALKNDFGKAYIGVGEPLALDAWLDERYPGWRQDRGDTETKPKWLHPVVSDLAVEVLTRVNTAAVVSPVALTALVLLSVAARALAEEDLIYLMEKLAAALRAAPYSRDISLPEAPIRDLLLTAERVAGLSRFQHPGGDVIFVDEREAAMLAYYRNNILHLIALPALIASFFQHNDCLTEPELVDGAVLLYPFLRAEFFLRWPDEEAPRVVAAVLQALVDQGLLLRGEATLLRRPPVTSRELTALFILGRSLGATLERYAVSTALLSPHAGEVLDRAAFETECLLMAQRIAILSGAHDPEFFDKALFKSHLNQLADQGYLADAGSDGRVTVDGRVKILAARSLNLLSGDIRHGIERLVTEGKKA